MYLEGKNRRRLTVGKHLRKLKGLRKRDPKAVQAQMPPQLQAYKQRLESEGMKVGPMTLGMFETSNGLKYPGFVATEDIPTHSVLLRVPVNSLLTTRDAYLSPIQRIFDENPSFFAKAFSSDWEDRLLLTYLLYEYQRGGESRWHLLLANLPRDIDYVAFWEEGELEMLADPWVKQSALRERRRVEGEQQQLRRILLKYPQFFKGSTLTTANIMWIHVHLVTRCFGKYFEYTTMVPFAELFNHECVDIYYTMHYDQDNPNTQNEVLEPPTNITDEEADEAASSDGSYAASDVSGEDQEFDEVSPRPLLDGESEVETEIRSIHVYIVTFTSFNDGVSLSFLAQVYERMQHLKTVEVEAARSEMQQVHSTCVQYLKMVKEFYSQLKFDTYSYGIRQKKSQQLAKKSGKAVEQGVDYFDGPWKTDTFDEFLMVCGSKDQFQKGSQVYFCYGRLPNRLLLTRYGIALEHNKYNHLFIRVDVSEMVRARGGLMAAVQEVHFNRYRKFKVKRAKMCLELMAFHRGLLWQWREGPEGIFYVKDLKREKEVIRMTKEVYSERLKAFKMSLEQAESRLTDPSLNYHEHFALIYMLEQQRILFQQLKMLDYALQIIGLLETGLQLAKVLTLEVAQQRLRLQLMMEVYFKYLQPTK